MNEQPGNNANKDLITCKNCGHTEPLTKKFKCSNCGAVNWGIAVPAKKNGCVTEIIIGIVFLAAVLGYNKYTEYRENHWSRARVEKAFLNNVVPVYHEYVYKLEFDDPNEEPVWFVRLENGDFTQWKKGMQPNIVTGCGLLTGVDGKCMATRNITRPRFSSWDLIGLGRETRIFREAFQIRSRGRYKIFTIKMGYYMPGKKMNDPGAFISCRESNSWAGGIYELAPQTVPAELKNISRLDVDSRPTGLKAGDPVYPVSFALVLDVNAIPAPQMGEGTINAAIIGDPVNDEFSYTYSTPKPIEGSPVFSEAGKLIGFSTFDSTGMMKAVGFGMRKREM